MPHKKPILPSRRDILRGVGLAIGAAASSRLGVRSASAAGYPDRPIKIIVPFAPAGPTDIMARILAQNLAPAIGGNIITENRSGAGGNIGIGYAGHAEILQDVDGRDKPGHDGLSKHLRRDDERWYTSIREMIRANERLE